MMELLIIVSRDKSWQVVKIITRGLRPIVCPQPQAQLGNVESYNGRQGHTHTCPV